MKICLVSDTVYDVNGVSRFIQDFAKEALEHSKPLTVLTSTAKEHYESIENIENIKPSFRMKMPFYKSLELVFPNYFKIHQKLKLIQPDLLHISTPGTVGLCALIASKFLKIPVVGIYHTDFPSYMYENTQKRWVQEGTKLFLKLFYRNYKALFTRTKEYKKIIEKDLNFDAQEIYTLKAGININNFDTSFYDETIWKNYGIKTNIFKALYVGRISVEKNVDKLLDIWTKVEKGNKVLILVGDDELGLDKEFCHKHNIIYLGRKQKAELSTIYASSDCFLFPSTTDTLGQVVMEAMASGMPVIVTTQGGPKTFVQNSCGYKIPIEEQGNWVTAIDNLALRDATYKTMALASYQFMQDNSIGKSFLDFWKTNELIYKRLDNKKSR